MIGVLLLFPLPPRPHPSLVLIPVPQPPVAVKSSCRLRAAKRSFTPSTPLKKTARRRVNGNKSRNGDETRGATAAATAKGSHECEAAGATVAEVFPTGLVVSKHFRESFTGREILMLEVEKVGEAEEACAAVFLFSVADAATPLRSVAPGCVCVCVVLGTLKPSGPCFFRRTENVVRRTFVRLTREATSVASRQTHAALSATEVLPVNTCLSLKTPRVAPCQRNQLTMNRIHRRGG